MAVKDPHDDPVFCGGLNEVESDGLLRGGGEGGRGEGVDDENLQVVVWQDKFCSKKFCVTCSGSLDFNEGDCVSYKDDNSTLAPAFPVLSVGFISSDIESVIHCQVGLLDGAYINAVMF